LMKRKTEEFYVESFTLKISYTIIIQDGRKERSLPQPQP
jgi:hypothetical protein